MLLPSLALSLLTSLFLSGQAFPEGTWAIITAEGSQVSPPDLLTLKSIPVSECVTLCQAACPPQLGEPTLSCSIWLSLAEIRAECWLGGPRNNSEAPEEPELETHKTLKTREEGRGRPVYRCAAAGRLMLQVEKVRV